MPTIDRLLYRVTEAADALSISRARCYELIAAGVIPSVRLGSSIRVPVDALKEHIANRLAERTNGDLVGAR